MKEAEQCSQGGSECEPTTTHFEVSAPSRALVFSTGVMLMVSSCRVVPYTLDHLSTPPSPSIPTISWLLPSTTIVEQTSSRRRAPSPPGELPPLPTPLPGQGGQTGPMLPPPLLSELHAGQPLCWWPLSATPIRALPVSFLLIISVPCAFLR